MRYRDSKRRLSGSARSCIYQEFVEFDQQPCGEYCGRAQIGCTTIGYKRIFVMELLHSTVSNLQHDSLFIANSLKAANFCLAVLCAQYYEIYARFF
jgi:hypothetical protein